MSEQIQQAMELHQAGNLARAEALYGEILRLTPDHPDALHMLGILHAQTGRQDSALALMLKSVQAAPSRGDYLFNLAMAYTEGNRPDEALDIFLKYTKIAPNDAEAISMIARIFHDRGEFDRAIEYYQRALALSPRCLPTLNSLGKAYFEKGFPEKAVSFYHQALMLDRRDPLVLTNLGQALNQQGHYDQAAEICRQALEIDLNNATASLYLGVALTNKQMYRDAEVNFRRAIAIRPDFTEAHANLGIALQGMNRYAEAESCLHHVLSVNREDAEDSFSLGLLLRKLGRLGEAEAAFARKISLKPDSPEGHYWLGVVLFETAKYVEAADSFRQAIACRPGYREPRIFLAIDAWMQGDFAGCEKYCRFDNHDPADQQGDAKFILPYQIFLSSLLGHVANHSEDYRRAENLPTLYAIGDSHCLAVAHTTVRHQGHDYLVSPKLVVGAKAWHLGNPVRNEFKYSFEKQVEAIPRESIALVMFGEIDCRHNEGIILHHKKTGSDLKESVERLVGDYLDYIIPLLKKREIHPVVVNVPAPLLDTVPVPEEDRRLQALVIEAFNLVLAEKLLAGNLPLLDVYAFTGEGRGLANAEYYIDGFHLLPSVYGRILNEAESA